MGTASAKKRSESIRIADTTKYTSGSIQALQGNTCRLFLNFHDENGKRHQKSRTYRAADKQKLSKREANIELQRWAKDLELQEELERQRALEEERKAKEPKPPTVDEYMRSYIDSRALKVERRTVSDYNSILNKHISPWLGSYRITELNPELVQGWVNECAKNYSSSTVRKALILLRSAMTEAVERDTLAKNPTRTVHAPKVEKTNPNALGADGRAKLVKFIAIDPASAASTAYSLALFMGMREGEICALRWRYVDLEGGQLEITEAMGRDDSAAKEEHWYIKEPKTGGSHRTLSIPAQLIPALQQRLDEAKASAKNFGMDWRDYFVVGSIDGAPMNGDMLGKRWRATACALDLVGIVGKRPTFHDLRHTWATKAVTDGTDIKTVSSIMGHSNAAMTLNTYTSADPAAKRAAAQNVADSMFAEAEGSVE